MEEKIRNIKCSTGCTIEKKHRGIAHALCLFPLITDLRRITGCQTLPILPMILPDMSVHCGTFVYRTARAAAHDDTRSRNSQKNGRMAEMPCGLADQTDLPAVRLRRSSLL